jgi:hypothetical protein
MPKHDPPAIRPTGTCTRWLAFQEHRKDAVGDLARVVRKDSVWPGWRTIDGFEQYGRETGFSKTWLAALRQAEQEWNAARSAKQNAN